uniref:Uncharacterized protein n=1 Tax=Paramoeba aestuarina TaxID=180227 RepID=A0A7S4L9A1_9EUKA|mmetsp:Transcript_33792/g.52868  ORF Transcript_33792/g.52868 Transcript_33792/m.52868 type:complete len:162 (+) Transcript_33792:18-503(+)
MKVFTSGVLLVLCFLGLALCDEPVDLNPFLCEDKCLSVGTSTNSVIALDLPGAPEIMWSTYLSIPNYTIYSPEDWTITLASCSSIRGDPCKYSLVDLPGGQTVTVGNPDYDYSFGFVINPIFFDAAEDGFRCDGAGFQLVDGSNITFPLYTVPTTSIELTC